MINPIELQASVPAGKSDHGRVDAVPGLLDVVGPVTWVMLSEIFPNFIMGKAMGIAVAAQWIANLFVSRSFKVLDGNSTLNTVFNRDFAYWIYGVMNLAAAAFVLRDVPETKGRSLEAIRQMWHGKATKTKVA